MRWIDARESGIGNAPNERPWRPTNGQEQF
jgi:hypothetical protein